MDKKGPDGYQSSFFRRDLAVDMGTTNTLIYSPRKGIILQEPSVVAIDKRTGDLLAAGRKAYLMLGKTPVNIKAVKPLREGVVADFNYAQKMLQHFLFKAVNKIPLVRLRAIITIPYGTTQVERQAVITAGKRTRIREIYLIEEPLAAAIGTGLPIEDSKGSLIINMGGGVTEIAAVAMGGIIFAKSIRQGGDSLDSAIQRYVYHKFSMEIGSGTAKRTKHEIGYALNPPSEKKFEIRGINWKTQKPDKALITAPEVNEAIAPILHPWTMAIKNVFDQVHPQFASDVLNSGLFLVGGGALLKNIDLFLNHELNLPVNVVKEPLTSVVLGASLALKYFKHLTYLELYRA
ncbi:MAG: rod shape-determining protein [Firmicutes bacterium]|nr:rod shape-determining protein [Bacillota bacterium]